MPYYHIKDNGKIGFWSRRCSKCGKKWSIMAWFQYPPPKDMSKFVVERKEKKVKKAASYAKWADGIPGVGLFASFLPNWPRWVRILVVAQVIPIIGVLVWILM